MKHGTAFLASLLTSVVVAQPACDPQFVSSLRGTVYDLDVIDSIAYVANGNEGLVLYDVSDPIDPRPISNNAAARLAVSIASNGSATCIGGLCDTTYCLQFFDTTVPAAPVVGASFTLSSPSDIEIEGNVQFAMDGYEALRIFDVSIPACTSLIFPAVGPPPCHRLNGCFEPFSRCPLNKRSNRNHPKRDTE